MSVSSFGRWAPPESPLSVDYADSMMEEIREHVTDGFHRLARGGLEVGGVLFGKRDGNRLIVCAQRIAECTYARGPQYVFSESDRQRFAQVRELHRSDPDLAGLEPVGWYVSHTRSELVPSANDQEISATWFTEPWQILLVLRPGRVGSVRAGFFPRLEDGTFGTERSLLEFNVDPLRQAAPPPVPTAPMTARPEAVPQAPPSPAAVPDAGPRRHRGRQWLAAGLVASVIVCGMVGAALYYYPVAKSGPPVPIALQVREVGGELRAEWNRNAPAIVQAGRATLEITDDGDKRSIALSTDQLSAGSWPFLHRSGDVGLKLQVADAAGHISEEFARYLGRAAKPRVAAAAKPTPDKALEDENARLRQELKQQRGKVGGLEKRIDQLNNLLRIERDRSAVLRKD